MGQRARALAAHLQERFEIRIAYREGNKLGALLKFISTLRRARPRVAYVFDMSYSGVLGAWLYRLLARNVMLVDTGDAIYELARSTGNRGRLGVWLTGCFEKFSLRAADGIVVRGSFHKKWLAEHGIRAEVVQDGVEVSEFAPLPVEELRKQQQLNDVLTVGLIGSSIWSEKLGMCYGWELVEVLRDLKDAPVKGLMIGGGSGIERLKERCREYGIEDRVLFMGYVPYEELPRYLSLIDVCLSTQSNDLVGQVRTTGKLPLYLAAGRYILASDVGEAALVLDKEMLVEYEGVRDDAYPQRLVERIRTILSQPEMLARSTARNIALAREHFDYALLANRLGDIIETIEQEQSR